MVYYILKTFKDENDNIVTRRDPSRKNPKYIDLEYGSYTQKLIRQRKIRLSMTQPEVKKDDKLQKSVSKTKKPSSGSDYTGSSSGKRRSRSASKPVS